MNDLNMLLSCSGSMMSVCDKGEGVKKFEIFMDVIDGSPLYRKNKTSCRS